jgi:sigma-B regulation protein RsbU (phosphoserine phosphatase)
LKVKENILGAIYVDNRLQVGLFTQADLDLLSAIAASAAIAIENARLYQVAVEKGRMERDLQLAYKVQSSLLPLETPSYAGWEFATRWIPAREVAGDFFDFFPVGDGELGIVIADVADKGIASALFMASCRSVIRGSMQRVSSPQDGINSANRLIHADATDGNFITLFYAQVNPESGEMVYVNAGHNPPLLVRRGADVLQKLTLTGMALGVIEDFNYEQRAINLNPGDMIFLFTDGVSEAVDIASAEFGEVRLEKFVLDNQEQTAEDLAASLETTLEVFTASTQPFDDITIVVIKRTSAS